MDFYELASCLGKKYLELKSGILSIYLNSALELIDDQYYISNKDRGISMVFDSDEQLISIQLHSGRLNSYKEFKESIPFNINFNDTLDSATKKIPCDSILNGGGHSVPILGLIPEWRKFNFQDVFLHLQSSEQGKIDKISVFR